jgi:hypothetical protein
MAAGLGFKTFTTGEVLTAADTNGYLMQGVLVFASAAARDAAITSPQEGQCCYLKDTDAVLTYSGAAWVGFDDSNAIQNAIVDAKGDLIGATAADTPARLAVGTNGQVLTADSTAATGLKWATASQKVVQIVAANYSTVASVSSTTFTDTGLTATITPTSASNNILVFWSQGGLVKSAGGAANGVVLKLLRGATQIGYAENLGYTNSVLINTPGNASLTLLDSPATTSATTYKSQFCNGTNGASVTVQYASSNSTLVLMEVTP